MRYVSQIGGNGEDGWVVAAADGCRRLRQLDLREWASAP
jgi:hypothetical protein